MPRRLHAHLARAAGGALVVGSLTACSLVGGDDQGGEDLDVMEVEPGQCFAAPGEIKAQISDLTLLDCEVEHAQEAYAVVRYPDPPDSFPGDEALTKFAEGACAQEFREYVGVDYLDSKLFFTYLVPSPRSWQDDDRETICLVTNAGEPLTGSVQGSKR
ncbi:septum formation family protein [Nocardioides sp.]|uniref:septum formation family protein n=1 Tax=Nocardioides sp. TaxID=35761 RepID=UPI0035665CCC